MNLQVQEAKTITHQQ